MVGIQTQIFGCCTAMLTIPPTLWHY